MNKNLPSSEALLVAIRAKCMDCSGNQRKEVERCRLKDCPLHPYRSVKAIGGEHAWNPVTGCLHGCEYCYARGIANRFAGCDKLSTYMPNCQATWRRVNPDSKPEDAIFEVDAQCPPINIFFDAKMQKVIRRTAPYPWGFQPTLRRDKLSEPSNWKKPPVQMF